MPVARPRLNSLAINVPPVILWRAPRPPTPRRSTIPMVGATPSSLLGPVSPSAPPVPSLSYWEPETPAPNTAPMSPCNPFLSPPLTGFAYDFHALFPLASPLLPAPPLSIFDHAVSPTMNTFLLSRSPSPTRAMFLQPETPTSPMTSRFLFPRSPPCPPVSTRRPQICTYYSVREIAQRRDSIASLIEGGGKGKMNKLIAKMKLEFYSCAAARKWRGMGMERDQIKMKKDKLIVKAKLSWETLIRPRSVDEKAETSSIVSCEHLRFRAVLCD
ncbi:Nn.00g101050.m01.CDS01 [Neocucurbitaria sp. VM-36]